MRVNLAISLDRPARFCGGGTERLTALWLAAEYWDYRVYNDEQKHNQHDGDGLWRT